MRIVAVVLAMACGSAAGQNPSAAPGLCARIRAMTAEPAVAAAHWGMSVTRLDGTVVCAVNEAQLFRPASNNKIFTTAAAIALLGADRKFETQVTGKLDAATGVVEGDLVLVGGGDANLDSNDLPYLPASERPRVPVAFAFHDLDDLASQLIAKGAKSVTGDIVGDDTLFPYEPYPPSWNGDDFVWGYGAPVSALTLADNQLKLTITAGKIAGFASVMLDQHGVPYYTVVNEVQTVAAESLAGVAVERLPGSRVVRVYGTIAVGAAPDNEELAIDDPAAYAAMALKGVLEARGVTVAGGSRAKHQAARNGIDFLAGLRAADGREAMILAGGEAGGNCLSGTAPPKLASHLSAGLLADVNLTNKVSQNLHAELLLHQLGRRVFCAQGSNVEGARMVRAFLLHAGVAEGDFLLYDGSGLSDHDLVAPRALTKFLTYAAGQPWFAQWKSTLPTGGVDGTLTSRFPNMKGRIAAKTGTLGETRALSGYVTTLGGQTLIFSVMVDTHLPGSADREVMDRIVNTLAELR